MKYKVTKREKTKNIFSWISMGCGILSFLSIIVLVIIYLYIENDIYYWDWFFVYWLSFLIASIIAISSGIYVVWGKLVNKRVTLRSCVGLISGNLCYLIFFPLIVIMIYAC